MAPSQQILHQPEIIQSPEQEEPACRYEPLVSNQWLAADAGLGCEGYAPPACFELRAEEGDSLASLALDYLGSEARWAELEVVDEAGEGCDPRQLCAGQLVRVPAAGAGAPDHQAQIASIDAEIADLRHQVATSRAQGEDAEDSLCGAPALAREDDTVWEAILKIASNSMSGVDPAHCGAGTAWRQKQERRAEAMEERIALLQTRRDELQQQQEASP